MEREKLDTSDFLARIGARLRFLRYEQGLSIRQLADLAECSAESIEQFEAGRLPIDPKTISSLAQALHVQPFDILNHDHDTNHLGWFVEAIRRNPSVLRFLKAKLVARMN
jgi:transcriptional regulator with XRE-family HTH domain